MAEPIYIAWQVQRKAPDGAWVYYGAPVAPISGKLTQSKAKALAYGMAHRLRQHLDERQKAGYGVRVIRIEQHAEQEL